MANTTTKEQKNFELIDRFWKASNYLSVGQVRFLVILHQDPFLPLLDYCARTNNSHQLAATFCRFTYWIQIRC